MNELKALILCGGKGERLRPITDDIPKPLVEIGGDTILSHQLKYLKNQGIGHFILATGYKSELIEDYIDKNFSNYNIKIINSGDVDIMLRVKESLDQLQEDFLICYGDTLANVNIKLLYQFHQEHRSQATVTSYQLESQFGVLEIANNGIVDRFKEKPKLDVWINIGFFIINPNIIQEEMSNFADFIYYLSKNKILYSYKHKDLHITINTLNELKQAEQNIKNFI
jgi:glucose-1-phosphate cytidylyltransferase